MDGWGNWGKTANGRGTDRIEFRCGGLEASAFPSSEQIAAVLAAVSMTACPSRRRPDSDHPLRHFDSALQVRMHGFVNLYLAAPAWRRTC